LKVGLSGTEHTNLARILSNNVLKGASFQVWVQVSHRFKIIAFFLIPVPNFEEFILVASILLA
jgi:hypothetical protein